MDSCSLLLAELRAAHPKRANTDDPDGISDAIETSKNDVPPMPLRKTCAWSFVDHARITGTPLLDLSNKDEGDDDYAFGTDADDVKAGPSSGVKEEDYDVFYQ